MAKADLQNLETPWREQVGRAVQRAFSLAGISQKEAAALLGHKDQSQVCSWIAGRERPQFDLLLAVEVLRQPIIFALAELVGHDVEIETTMRFRVRRRA